MSKPLNFLCIGHSCHDKKGDSYILGGTASYASLLINNLGISTEIITSVGEDFQFEKTFTDEDINFINSPANHTTVFENIYDANGHRTQFMHHRANTIGPLDTKDIEKQVDILLLGLIADEVNFDILKQFPNTLKGATIQGCLRHVNEDGLVSPKEMDWKLLAHLDMVILSTQDILGFPDALDNIRQYCNHVVLTDGDKPAHIFYNKKTYSAPAYKTKEIDTTGAGDTFAACYLLEYARTNDVAKACVFAHCAASIIVEHEGLMRLPSLEEINSRLREYSF